MYRPRRTYRFEWAHSKEVCHHGAEPWRKTGLCDEAELELCETDDVVALLPVPAGDVEQVGLVVVLHQLDDHPDVVAVVLDRDHPHDVGRVLRVRVLAVLVRQHQARISFAYLWQNFLTLCMLNSIPLPYPCQWNSLKILESIWLLCASSSRVSPGQDLVRRCGGKPLQRRHSHDLHGGSPSGSLTPSRRICFRRQWYAWWYNEILWGFLIIQNHLLLAFFL